MKKVVAHTKSARSDETLIVCLPTTNCCVAYHAKQCKLDNVLDPLIIHIIRFVASLALVEKSCGTENAGVDKVTQTINMVHNGLGQFPHPQPALTHKEWHAAMTPDLRSCTAEKLVKAILTDPTKHSISYAQIIEKDIFETANSKKSTTILIVEHCSLPYICGYKLYKRLLLPHFYNFHQFIYASWS
uniref:Uncharacterized protein n=1 Tax=Ditylenchus dipsaci TaxID=166011 RepID=A0A915DI45_9BILA